MKKRKEEKSKLEKLSSAQIQRITEESEKRSNIPLIKSGQVNMRLPQDILNKAKKLAKTQGLPYTTFLTKLLKEDIDRLWEIFKKVS